jgi:hypothetical protein
MVRRTGPVVEEQDDSVRRITLPAQQFRNPLVVNHQFIRFGLALDSLLDHHPVAGPQE